MEERLGAFTLNSLTWLANSQRSRSEISENRCVLATLYLFWRGLGNYLVHEFFWILHSLCKNFFNIKNRSWRVETHLLDLLLPMTNSAFRLTWRIISTPFHGCWQGDNSPTFIHSSIHNLFIYLRFAFYLLLSGPLMNLAAELRQMKDNISHVQSLASDKLVGYS